MKIILASASPRRQELLKRVFSDFDVVTASVDEKKIEERIENDTGRAGGKELARRMVRELSRAKASAVFDKLGCPVDTLVIGADTVVVLRDEILGKPVDRKDAVRMLRAQSLEPQSVITGVTLIIRSIEDAGCGKCCKKNASVELSTRYRSFAEESLVFFKSLDEAQEARIQQYCDTDEPYDKAGAYGIQLNGSSLVDHYEGDYDNIVGFPVEKVRKEISDFIDNIN